MSKTAAFSEPILAVTLLGTGICKGINREHSFSRFSKSSHEFGIGALAPSFRLRLDGRTCGNFENLVNMRNDLGPSRFLFVPSSYELEEDMKRTRVAIEDR